MVSHTWYKAGIGLLYKDIVIRRLNQLPALLETLEKSPTFFGVLVKQITLDMFVPHDYGASFTRTIQRITDLCPRLQGFIYTSPCPLPSKAFLPKLTTLKHLKVGPAISPTEYYQLLKNTRKSLVSLSIHVHDPNLETLKIYSLPRLENLTLQIDSDGVDAWAMLSNILIMPKLSSLSIQIIPSHLPEKQPKLTWSSLIEPITTFCERYAGTLRYLNVNPGFCRKSGDVQPLLDVCPNLEHMVVYNGAEMELHSNLKYVDICTSKMFGPEDSSQWPHDSARNRLRKSLTPTPATFPNLLGIRHIHLCSPHLYDLPSHLPPESAVKNPKETYELTFPGIYLHHGCGYVCTQRHVDVIEGGEGGGAGGLGGGMYEDPVYTNFDYVLAADPDRDRTDATSSVSELSLGELRQRELDVGCWGREGKEMKEEEEECETVSDEVRGEHGLVWYIWKGKDHIPEGHAAV
ncbi:hypothetical protein H0H93_004276 [Arthromyces matolae]|nr:hypothetical protein H0H93_004276 [Arthromyces matolae]